MVWFDWCSDEYKKALIGTREEILNQNLQKRKMSTRQRTETNPWENEEFHRWMRLSVVGRWDTAEKLHQVMHGEGGLVTVEGKAVRLSEKTMAAKAVETVLYNL